MGGDFEGEGLGVYYVPVEGIELECVVSTEVRICAVSKYLDPGHGIDCTFDIFDREAVCRSTTDPLKLRSLTMYEQYPREDHDTARSSSATSESTRV